MGPTKRNILRLKASSSFIVATGYQHLEFLPTVYGHIYQERKTYKSKQKAEFSYP